MAGVRSDGRATIGWCLGAALAAAAGARAQDAAPDTQADIVESVLEEPRAQADADADLTEAVTESIVDDPGGDASEPAPVSAGDEPPSSRTKVTGWGRESLELYPFDRGLRRDDPSDVSGVPRDRFVSNTQLSVRATYQRGKLFEATVSGVLGVSVNVEGSGKDLPLRNFQSQGTVELLDARLMELYFGLFLRSFDIRIGQQRVAWGVADVLSPNDVVNARDLRDPFLGEPELNHVPTPMVRLGWDLGPVLLEGLVSPLFVPDRGVLYGRNWAAVQPNAPAEYRGLFSVLGHGTDPSIRDQLNGALYQTRLPNTNGNGVSAGAKLALHTPALDLDLYYHYGYDGMPYLWLDPAFANVIKTTDFAHTSLSDLSPLLRALDQGLTPFLAEYVRRHHAGFDAVIPIGPVMLRLDAAYQSQRVFYRADYTSIARPAVLSVLSLDYQTGSLEKVLVLEAVYVRVLERAPSEPLLVYERDSYGLAGVMRWPLFSVFHLELRALVGIAPQFYTLQPSLIAKVGGLQIKAGALVMDGEPNSLGWYYQHNTAAFLQFRYGF